MSLVAEPGAERGHSLAAVGVLGVSPRWAEHESHVGYPTTMSEKLDLVRRGLPVYWPTDPQPVDQRPYLAFAAKRPPNSQ